MDDLQRTRSQPSSGPSVRTLLAAPVRVQTYRNLLYLLAQLPLGIAYFTTLVTLGATGLAGAIIFTEALPEMLAELGSEPGAVVGLAVAVPLLVVIAASLLVVGVLGVTVGGVAAFTADRLLSGAILGRPFPHTALSWSDADSPRAFLASYLRSPGTYLAAVWTLLKFPIGVAVFVLLTVPLTFSAVFLAAPLLYNVPGADLQVAWPGVFEFQYVDGFYTVDSGVALEGGRWAIDTLPEALLMSAFGVLVLLAALNLFNLLAWLLAELTAVASRHAGVFAVGVRE